MARACAGLCLSSGSRVAIVGGGPAGSFAALHLLRFAHQLSLPLTVTIFERKDFRRRGPEGCNKCAGILSTRAVQGLRELGLQIPERLVMARLEGYVLHLASRTLEIAQPEPDRTIISVYRGGGPRCADLAQDVSFDAWLLDEARAAGAEVVAANVRKISAGARMKVTTDAKQEAFDLIFLANGVNAHPPALEGVAYRPPRTEVMAQDELALDKPLTLAQRTQAHVYVGQQARLIFGALIPKGDLLNVSLLGHGLRGDPIGDFLQRVDCRWLKGAGCRRLCGCRPRIAVTPPQRPFADRFVAVGDAAVTRLYKDGLGSALATARQAAWTALYAGISQAAFARHYGPLCRSIAWDNHIGQLLFWPWQGRQSWLNRLWERGWRHVLETEQALPVHRRYAHQALWSMLTGDDSYARIARRALHPAMIGVFLRSLLGREGPGKGATR